MVDDGKSYSIGHLRMKYLNEADNVYAMGGMENILRCKRIIDNFLGTIKEDSDAAEQIQKRFDEINSLKRNLVNSLDSNTKNIGYLERKDADAERDMIEVNSIHDMKVACWIVALKYKLFDEDDKAAK